MMYVPQRVSVNMKTLDYNANFDEELQTVCSPNDSLIIFPCNVTIHECIDLKYSTKIEI